MKTEHTIVLHALVGSFAEDKDAARDIRVSMILPSLKSHDAVVLDFFGIESSTQSFMHALLSGIIRDLGPAILDRIYFKNCNDKVQTLIEIVVDYSQAE